jgi:hypothetical protein
MARNRALFSPDIVKAYGFLRISSEFPGCHGTPAHQQLSCVGTVSKPAWKLVTDYTVTEYRCGARAGDRVRLRRDIVVTDHSSLPTGEVYHSGDIWLVLPGAAEDLVWLRQANGERHTWSDNADFLEAFEIIG